MNHTKISTTTVNILLMVAAAYIIARLITNSMMDKPGITVPRGPMYKDSAPAVFKNNFKQVFLFGKNPLTKIREKPVNTKIISNLNLKLLGVISFKTTEKSAAIIRKTNEVKTFVIGDEIMPGVKLEEIYPRYVVIKHNGIDKVIEMKKEHNPITYKLTKKTGKQEFKGGNLGHGERMPKRWNHPSLDQRISNYKKQLTSDPTALINLFVGTPVTRDNNLYGIMVRPGMDKGLFDHLKLKPRDIILSINDIPINNPGRINELIDLVQHSDFFDIELERDGAVQTLTVNLQ